MNKVRFEESYECHPCSPAPRSTDVIACLLATSREVEEKMHLCTNVHDEYEKISLMIDSGSSETVASSEKLPGYELLGTDAVGTKYSSASEDGKAIVNAGEKIIEIMDANGTAN